MTESFANYLALQAVNWSSLKEMRRSPLHYNYRVHNERPDTAGLRRGRAAHTAVFEPDRFLLDYAVFKGKVRKGKVWDAFREQHADQSIINLKEYATALALRDSVRSNERAKPYLLAGHGEKTITWTDPETGLKCKARLDFESTSKPAIVDLKSTASIAFGAFTSTSYRMAYQCQLGFYQWGYKVATGIDLPVYIIAAETAAPHDVAVFEYAQDCLDTGRDEARSLLTKLAYHRETNTWPGQYPEEQYLEFPAWVDATDNEDTSDLGLEQ